VSEEQINGPAFICTTPPVGGTGTITCTDATLAAGASATFQVVVNVGASVALGTLISNTAVVSTTTTDPNPGNNTSTVTTPIVTSADLLTVKLSEPNPVLAGANLTYTITVSNLGPSDAQNVIATDTLPVGTTFVSAIQTSGPVFTITSPPVGTNGTIQLNDGTLAAGATATFKIVVHVNASVPNGSILRNTVTVTSNTDDPNLGNNTSTATNNVTARADLDVHKTASVPSVLVGQSV